MALQAVLFDLDGTLIDQFTTIWRCVNHAQALLGFPLSDYATVRSTVGGSIYVTMTRLMDADHAAEGVRLFREQFDKIWFEDVRALPGAAWILRALHEHGLRVGVFTNKQQHGSENVLRYLGLDAHLSHVLGTSDDGARSGWRKPEPRFTEWALAELGAQADTTAMVGDSPFDHETGANVQMPTWLVSTGSHTHEQLAPLAPGRVYPDLKSLGQQVFGLKFRG